MTQLDRLEALVEELPKAHLRGQDVWPITVAMILEYLPELTQTVRLAMAFCQLYEERLEMAEPQSKMIFPASAFEDLYTALAKLFSEDES